MSRPRLAKAIVNAIVKSPNHEYRWRDIRSRRAAMRSVTAFRTERTAGTPWAPSCGSAQARCRCPPSDRFPAAASSLFAGFFDALFLDGRLAGGVVSCVGVVVAAAGAVVAAAGAVVVAAAGAAVVAAGAAVPPAAGAPCASASGVWMRSASAAVAASNMNFALITSKILDLNKASVVLRDRPCKSADDRLQPGRQVWPRSHNSPRHASS